MENLSVVGVLKTVKNVVQIEPVMYVPNVSSLINKLQNVDPVLMTALHVIYVEIA